MDGMESCDVPPPNEYRDNGGTRNQYQGIRAHHFHTMINGNVSNVKNSHRPTKTVVGILGFVTIGLIVLVAVLVTHYMNDSNSTSSSRSAQAASVISSKPISTSASPSSTIPNTFAPMTTTPIHSQVAAAVSAVTTPETETVTSTSSGFATTYLSVCIWGCPGYACKDVNDCRDPYCCNQGTCDATHATCGPSPSCSDTYSGIC